MRKRKVIYWFRQDLRLRDNPALAAASKQGEVLPVYILDDLSAAADKMGAASRWWLHHSLASLHQSFHQRLCCYQGDAKQLLLALVKRHQIDAVYWNRCYEPWHIKQDQQIQTLLEQRGIDVCHDNGSLLWEPWEITKKDGTPYKVFTPFYRRGCLNAMAPRRPLAAVSGLKLMHDERALSIDALNLLPTSHWDKGWTTHWQVGEKGAQERLSTFLKKGIEHYHHGRNFPELPKKNLQKKFDAFPWKKNQTALKRWQRGETGYPIVDAGMRELWQTGYMHGRVRMIVGSFLVKNLLLHWHHGEVWFWDCLVDADLANNSASWQWIVGCGSDAAPYFRIFNPVTQGIKFDPDGEYTKQFVSELANLPLKYLFSPWEAPERILKEAGVVLGKTYPRPIVELKASRERALAAFVSLKERA